MDEQVILDKEFTLSWMDRKQNIVEELDIQSFNRQAIEYIKIDWGYTPSKVTNKDEIFKFFNTCKINNIEAPYSLENLLTVSILNGNDYIGCRHSKRNKEQIVISTKESSLGYNVVTQFNQSISIVLNCHEIVSKFIDVFIKVSIGFIYQQQNLKVELHSHTVHSDGDYTVNDLLDKAKDRSLDVLCITDHNTTSALQEIPDNGDLLVVKGQELTTYFGHLLLIGSLEDNVVWYALDKDNIDELIQQKHSQQLVGIAHPFEVGNPICTGCRFEYNNKFIKEFDFIEVINHVDMNSQHNKEAINWYKELLNNGIRIALTSGSDWHRDENFPYPNLYVSVNNKDENQVLQAIRSGNSYISNVNHSEFRIDIDGQSILGEDILDQQIKDIEITMSSEDQQSMNRYILSTNLGEFNLKKLSTYSLLKVLKEIVVGLEWFMLEGYLHEQLVMLTNPVFIKEDSI